MIKYVKHGKKDYIVIDSTFQINEINCPIQVQVDVTKLKQGERLTIFRAAQIAFHRNIDVSKKKTSNEKKPWWKIF
jgi:hypothetical protein